MSDKDTIVAVATPPGYGGIGVIRISGSNAASIAAKICSKKLTHKQVIICRFLDENKNTIDEGLGLYFKSPHSFTGEDIVELQGHGGPVVLDLLCRRITQLGARLARAGEFSERAFLNNKIDLAQAEAIADLIVAESEEAAKAALISLQGDFSKKIHEIVEKLTQFRIYVESTLDFPEEEIDFLADKKIDEWLNSINLSLDKIKKSSRQGRVLQEGLTVAIIGNANVGKSSLLNQLTGNESAIVTNIPGTTRDVLREKINIHGLPVHIIDTAGLRESTDEIEQEGIRRAKDESEKADLVLYVYDSAEKIETKPFLENISGHVCHIFNKIDLLGGKAKLDISEGKTTVSLSAKTGEGIDLLRDHIKEHFLGQQSTEGIYSTRRRHTDAIDVAADHFVLANKYLKSNQGELLAEELRLAQNSLASITGEFSSDDLLGRIFSEFCIGK